MLDSFTAAESLKEAVQLTGAKWAVCVVYDNNRGWDFNAVYGVNKKRQGELRNYLNLESVDRWLTDALAAGKTRLRKVPKDLDFNIPRLFIFPLADREKIIVIGSKTLSNKEKRIWTLLARAKVFGSDGDEAKLQLQPADAFIFGGHAGVPYDLPNSLSHVLSRVAAYIPCAAGWLAIYEETSLKVKAHWRHPEIVGREILVRENEILQEIIRKGDAVLVDSNHPDWEKFIRSIAPKEVEVWAAIPLKVGQRLIGVISLWRSEPFSEDEWLKLQQFSVYAAASVEIFVTFAEMANHLRRQAMLNDFALIVSSAQNLEQIVRRVFALLARTFNTKLLSIFLFSSDGRTLREYRNIERRETPRTEFVENHPVEKFVRRGVNIRIENTENEPYGLGNQEAKSALLVLLKYRGEIIGVLSLESDQVSAFNEHDENLLVVIASHLAGLVEYGRLREEAEARARDLGLIHQVIQEVIGLTNLQEVAQITADLLVEHFSYELAAVFLEDRNKMLNIEGISGEAASLVKQTFESLAPPRIVGVSGHVFSTGESVMVDDISKSKHYKPVPGWSVGSAICVPLRESDHVLGVINVEAKEKNAFTHSDLLALESLAGFLTSVVSSVDRYQMLQDTIQILQTTQEELQERMEAQQAAENKLVQAAKLAAVGEMAAGVAHELNNPLTTVAGFSELVLEDMSEESPQREDLELVLHEAKRARSVVRRLLDFARQSESVRIRSDVNEVIEDVAVLMRHLLETNEIDFQIQLGEKLPWVVMDRDQIKQVILNLLHNALHAMPQGGKLFVTTETQKKNGQNWLTIGIQDTGKGITANDLGRIFEPFFTTKTDDGGTGLGLAVSYGIITDHNGFIDVESEPDQGTTFIVWLPVEENSK